MLSLFGQQEWEIANSNREARAPVNKGEGTWIERSYTETNEQQHWERTGKAPLIGFFPQASWISMQIACPLGVGLGAPTRTLSKKKNTELGG